VLQAGCLARQDSSASLQNALSDKLVERAPTRGGRNKTYARQPDFPRLLRRTLAALERDLPALRAAELSRDEVATFLAEQLATLSEPSAPVGVRAVVEPRELPLQTSSCARDQAAVLDALRQLEQESPRGALLSVRELRTRSELDKPSFDRAALELAAEGRVSLHAHDHAGALAESERRALIQDLRGLHYVGIASMPDNCDEVSP
jgi:hypothetical protein